MQITYVKTNLYTNKNKFKDVSTTKNQLKAFVSITLNNCFVIHNIKLIENEKGLFIAMPSIKNAKGNYVDVAHPINTETRQMIETNVKKTFQDMIDKKETRIESEINKNKEDSFLVTNVKINLFPNSKNKLKGKASITLSDCFVVHGIKILIGEKGFFIAMPSTKNSKGVYVDIAHPINTETRQMIESSITKVFQEMINKESQSYVSDANDLNDESDTNDDESSEFDFKTNE